jgi:hypothetical protein
MSTGVKKEIAKIWSFCDEYGVKIKFTHRNRISEFGKCSFVAFDGQDVTVWNLPRDRELVRGARAFPKAAVDACGYTLCEATLPAGRQVTGIAICSAKDTYNGDLGMIKSFYDMLRRR